MVPPISEKSENYKKAAKTSNNAAYIVAGIYLINLIDAFLYRHDKSLAQSIKEGTQLSSGLEFSTEIQPGSTHANGNYEQNNVYKLEYTWRF
jgi:hypothetical protein